MTHETLDNKYDVTIKNREFLPDKENVEKIKLRVETALNTSDGEKVYQKNFVLKPHHFNGDQPRYKKAIKQWIDTLVENAESNIEVPQGKINTL